jgi:phospholipid/cholesterol/gamma-HCH transport system substrate-binding protein
VVLQTAISFLCLFIITAEVGTVQGSDLTAKFNKVGGLQSGNDVRINGISVGTVTQRFLDAETYEAVVTLTIKLGVKVPEDTVAIIGSGGQIGGKSVRLKPGKSRKNLETGATIGNTVQYR